MRQRGADRASSHVARTFCRVRLENERLPIGDSQQQTCKEWQAVHKATFPCCSLEIAQVVYHCDLLPSWLGVVQQLQRPFSHWFDTAYGAVHAAVLKHGRVVSVGQLQFAASPQRQYGLEPIHSRARGEGR